MVIKNKTARYIHLPIGKDVEAFAGYYTPEKEVRLNFNNREVLYVTGHMVIEEVCSQCTNYKPTNHQYANVPGYIVRWQFENNEEGLPVTEVEPIVDNKARDAIRDIILKNEPVLRVDFD